MNPTAAPDNAPTDAAPSGHSRAPRHPYTMGELIDQRPPVEIELLAEIVGELRKINDRLEHAETAGRAAGKLLADHVAPFFARLAANPKVARFLK